MELDSLKDYIVKTAENTSPTRNNWFLSSADTLMLLLVTCVINNWQGIYIGLLDDATKVLAKIVQECLQIIADSILTESQRGFQKGHRYIDMRGHKRTMFPCLYCLWTWRRPMTRYMHNVPCGMCWRSVMSHQPMLHIIRSFHEGIYTYILKSQLTQLLTVLFSYRDVLQLQHYSTYHF